MIERKPVVSSNIKSVGYDKANRILEVEFKTGVAYQYANIEENIVNDFLLAESLGKFFTINIRNKYQTTKINDRDICKKEGI